MFKWKTTVLVAAALAAMVIGCAVPALASYCSVGHADGFMLGTGDWDWYGVNLVRGVSYRVTLTVPWNADFDVKVYYDGNGNGIAESWELVGSGTLGIGRNESVYFKATRSGRYHIKVYSYSGSGFYTVKVARWC